MTVSEELSALNSILFQTAMTTESLLEDDHNTKPNSDDIAELLNLVMLHTFKCQ